MYSVMLKLVKNEEGYIVKGFLKAFKENFRQSTLMWLLYLVFGIVIVVDFMLLRMMSPSIRTVMQVIFDLHDYPADQHGDLWICVAGKI